jgi:hypothetical protein
MDNESNEPIIKPLELSDGYYYIQTDRDGEQTINIEWLDL